MNSLCMWCGAPAVRYCDAVIGVEPKGEFREKSGRVTLLAGLDSKQWTCDAPMCAEHAAQVGWICGEDPDSIDHCPRHSGQESPGLVDLLMTEVEAMAKRRKLHAEIRRDGMRIVRSVGASVALENSQEATS